MWQIKQMSVVFLLVKTVSANAVVYESPAIALPIGAIKVNALLATGGKPVQLSRTMVW